MLNNKHKSELVNTLKVNKRQVRIWNVPKYFDDALVKELHGLGCIQTLSVQAAPDDTVEVLVRFENDDSIGKALELQRIHVGPVAPAGHWLKVEVLGSEGDPPAVLDDPKDIADCLARRFAYISGDNSSDPRFKDLRDRLDKARIDFSTRDQHGYNKPFTSQELEYALGLASDSSPGPDEVLYSMLKHLAPSGKL